MKAKSIVLVVFTMLLMTFSFAVVVSAQDVVIEPLPCDEPGELTMWVWDENWAEIIGDSIEVWKAEYCPGAEVELIQQPWGNYWDLMRTNAAGGDLPDVFNMNQVFFGFYGDNGVLLNLQPYFDEFGLDTSVWGSGMIDPYRVGDDGDLHAAPVEWVTVAMLYNQDMFDAAGLDYPTAEWTWDDFAAAAEALTDPMEDVYGAAAYLEYQTGYPNWIAAAGESPVVAPQRAGCTLTSDASLEALSFLKGLYDEGYMPSVSVLGGASPDDAFNMFVSERIGIISAGAWKIQDAIDQIEFNWDIVQQPRHPETGRSRSTLHAASYVAAANSDNPELAANLILFLVSDEGQMFFAEAGGVAPSNPSAELQGIWADAYADADLNVQAYIDAVQDSVGVNLFAEIWDVANTELVVNIFDLDMEVEEAAELACEFIDEQIAELAED